MREPHEQIVETLGSYIDRLESLEPKISDLTGVEQHDHAASRINYDLVRQFMKWDLDAEGEFLPEDQERFQLPFPAQRDFTGKDDDAFALVEEFFPDHHVRLEKTKDGWDVSIGEHMEDAIAKLPSCEPRVPSGFGQHKIRRIALLIAFMYAMIDREEFHATED